MVIDTVLNDPFAPPAGRGPRLSMQEQDILARSATGWSTTSVAEDLGLTPEAVRQVLASVIKRVGARSQIEAVLIAVRGGLINLPADPEQTGDPTTGNRASASQPVARLRSWRVAGPPDAHRPLTLADARQRKTELRRDQLAEVDGAAS
jgi:DNA-binding CsgD family transcriptional regulator